MQKMSFHLLHWRRYHAVTEVDKELICKLNENYGYINTSTPLIPRQRGTGKYIMTEKLIAKQSQGKKIYFGDSI
jgi:hypothetical protein